VSAASLLDIGEATDKKGKKYYRWGPVWGAGARACPAPSAALPEHGPAHAARPAPLPVPRCSSTLPSPSLPQRDRYEFLVRSADGDEGGRHQLISAAVSNGKLLILKIQAGDKRWIYGVDREAKESWNSFTVA
jgi:hypothetical protein